MAPYDAPTSQALWAGELTLNVFGRPDREGIAARDVTSGHLQRQSAYVVWLPWRVCV